MHKQQLSKLSMVKVKVIAKIVITDGVLLNDVQETCVSMAVAGSYNSKQREILIKCWEAYDFPAQDMS